MPQPVPPMIPPLQPFSEMEHYKHADELPPEIMADSYDKLERLCLKYMNEDDFSKVEQAYCFAAEKHCNQKRRSGEMYINHPVEVAIILADLKMDCDVVCAALLHDTVEDTETSLADVSGLFGDTVAELVDGVTKLTNIEVDSMDEAGAHAAQDVPRHVQGHPRHRHQAGRPSAQYAHAGGPARGSSPV